MKKKALALLIFYVLLCMVLAACSSQSMPATASEVPIATAPKVADTQAPAAATDQPTTVPTSTEIILATTTSTRDSGLLDELLPAFEKEIGYKVKMIAVGSGAAIALGQEGNADVLLVHSIAAEKKYMDGGFGKERLLVMHNDFIIVGPESDPAKISSSASTNDAFKAFSESKSIFVSRADESGTNAKELAIWKAIEITPEGDWYLKSGQGMGDTLRIASEKSGYTITDRATFLSLKDTLDLTILYQGEKSLLNIYHVITVNPDKFTTVNYAGAKAFADWIVSSETQKTIAAFGEAKYGEPLFFADAGEPEDNVK
jgi:tungstate transport system substrate-binding protein